MYESVGVIRHQLVPAKTIMVGDRLDTDIAFGKMGGLSTLLVMTGDSFLMSRLYLTNKQKG